MKFNQYYQYSDNLRNKLCHQLNQQLLFFDTDAQYMCQFDLSFAPKDLFIVAGFKLTFSTIKYSDIAFSKLFVHPKEYGNLW